ncbi:DEAD/DEAH box helicase [Legionella hackeliae]|uniref:DEAD/DEAH box helicase-like protein n=1 Tax=Legionella hackeliae TaxID=449 RepID=A0A0A8UR07_LEGHA|nr:DEAD/DEAH box helicase [Legionella hackeliae]KTD15491.1 helicase, DEAD/DEAH box family [Legionella hackeliae]CEK11138.1 DEAD/DEAH box helicase-like protein [Legionella hackeliae]STX47896.1 helicase, DEAD/DEAH box family [Legionella hackeliae]
MNSTYLDSLKWAHPLVQEWFVKKFTLATEPQEQGWPQILAGNTTLISAPTGSGKTLAAFLVCIDRLVRQSIAQTLKNQTQVLYISPLKALTNDVQKNLLGPLEEIIKLGKEQGYDMEEIQVAVRTGDTLSRERQAMLKKPPHILVTTPESLYLLLTAEKSRTILRSVQTVIVDEIHALANSKRGTHLSLSLERLEVLVEQSPIRIGLSATQKPIEMVANFLTGNNRPPPVIVNIGHIRKLDLAIEVPSSELAPVASNELWDEIYERLSALARQNRSTLIFVNTRRLAERVAHHLAERLGKDLVAAHHGSLSRKLRLAAETKLKNGELKALVATASLELGIDIGAIDLVCQIGSPRSISVALQRIGRAGHWHGAISKGRIFATTRNELLECAALVHAIRQKDLDQLIIPEAPFDILAQQIIAACATDEWHEDTLYELVKRSFPYQHLSREEFDEILVMLAEGIAGSRGRYSAYLFRDRVNGIVKGRRGSRLTAITSGGAIPENGLFTVVAEPNEVIVGTLDEDFAVESNRGDIILLGNTSWKIKRIESAKGRVLVEDAYGAPPSVPFWRGEAPPRTDELSLQVSDLRKKINAMLPLTLSPVEEVRKQADTREAINWLKEHCGVTDAGAEQLVEYILEGRTVLGTVPTQETVIAERFFDESGGMQLVIHSPFGARINKAWGLALRKRFCRSFNFELQAAATDDGINISLAEQHSFPLVDVFNFLHPNTIADVLTQAVLQSPLFTTRWRWAATRALALVRFRNGRKVPPNILRMLSDDLLAAVFPDAAACQDNLAGQDIELPKHPLIIETMKDALTEALDIEGFTRVLQSIVEGNIQCLAVDTPVPSVFSHEILNANPYAFLDDAPLEERRARAVEMRRVLPDAILREVGALDPEAIAEVQKQAWPDIRNADELHDTLQSLIALPTDTHFTEEQTIPSEWKVFIEQLIAQGRAGVAFIDHQPFWVATEKKQTFLTIYTEAIFSTSLIDIEEKRPERDTAIVQMIREWMQHLGPISVSELGADLRLESSEIEQALLHLESSGTILRGHFRITRSELEWCDRRLLARIHSLTLGKLRKEIQPVSAAQFMEWLTIWQHIKPGTQLSGDQGLLETLKQMQGYEIPANAWEKQIFAKRVKDYSPDMLDRLCLTGVVGWGRLSPHPALIAPEAPENTDSLKPKRILPTSVAPITFFVREESDWMSAKAHLEDETLPVLSHVAQAIYAYLKENGASFFIDMVQGINHLKSEIETGLWELVSAGLITADGFDNLRTLIDPHRRLGKRARSVFRHSTGRWSLLKSKKAIHKDHQLEAICWVLLKRYGVCFRELLAREKIIPSWRDLLLAFRRLEAQGEIRGGRFVSGFIGEQFALPYAVDSVRAIKKKIPDENNISISAVDPLNLIGIVLPGERVSAFSGRYVILRGGMPVAEKAVRENILQN